MSSGETFALDAAVRLDGAAVRPPLRFLTCGSVDDGKSTLLGRLLYEQNLVLEDHLVAIESESRRHGASGPDVDFSLLFDGLEAEREQHITIDVAYRYFATTRRAFIVADTPGHEQYTRNMATGASGCDLAVLLVDARKGVLSQTRRHAIIVNLFGIRHVVLAVNKIDLVGFDRTVFDRVVASFIDFAAPLGFKDTKAIPISARYGDNVCSRSKRTAWYSGYCLLEHLETIDVGDDGTGRPFRMPVQWVNWPNPDFRGFSGTLVSGSARPGDEIAALPSGRSTKIRTIVGAGGELDLAETGDSVTITLADEIDVARGDMLVAMRDRPQVAGQFAAHVLWMSNDKLLPGRFYLMKLNHATVGATVTNIRHRIDINNLSMLAAKTLELNEIGVCNMSVARPLPFDPYADNRDTGAFILIDRFSNETVAAGMINFALRRATNVHLQNLAVSKAKRSSLKQHCPAVLWFTGLPGAGKSTIANLVEAGLNARGIHTIMLDGDNIRHGLNRDLGFTEADRVENIRRLGEVAKLMTEAGLVVLCAFISPFRAERQSVRESLDAGEFVEIFVDAPLEVCVARDAKGLYRRALAGEIKNFTGVDQPYEAPENSDIHLLAARRTPEALADQVLDEVVRRIC